jgi:hypothetical protein
MSVITAYFDHEDTQDARAGNRRLFVATLLTTFVLAFAAALLVFIPYSPDAPPSGPEMAERAQQTPFADQAALAAIKSNIERP